jgi:hypothetical protein
MDEARLDNELERLYKKLPFLWRIYDFRIKYFTRSYGMYHRGFIIGLENDICKLLFEKESNSSVEPIKDYIGKKSAYFKPPNYSYYPEDGWYSLTGLANRLSGVQYESDKNTDKDLDNMSQYLTIYMNKVLDLFRDPEEFDNKLKQIPHQNKENKLTIDKIKAERARLQALGQDSSLEAAINSLRGGKK